VIDEYVKLCESVNAKDSEEIILCFGKKAADNMRTYTREWIDGKIQFMLGQLKIFSKEAVFLNLRI